MNLYDVFFCHYGPKDSESGTAVLLLAESDEAVFEWLLSEPEVNGDTLLTHWKYRLDKTYNIYDDNYKVIGVETFKERMVRLRGEANDDNADVEDTYYGVTHYGWALLKENVHTDYSELIELGAMVKI